MSVQQEQQFITTEEFGRERRRLIAEGVPDDAPEFQELWRRAIERSNYLYDRYGKQYYDSHYGKWIAISPDGEVIIKDTAGQCIWAASEAFGDGNFAMRKLNEVGGHRFHS